MALTGARNRESGYLQAALSLARRGYGTTSPNPMVGAILVKRGVIIGRGWHHRAGEPHAEIEAIRNAQKRGHTTRGAALYVTLEPCSTHGRTPPCTDAIVAAGIKRVVAGAIDPNPRHRGLGLKLLRRAGLAVSQGVMAEQCAQLNEAFNHWVVEGTPFVTVKAAMTLDGKIATAAGESKWITGEQARAYGMKLRQGVDAILVGINTVIADDPSLTVRSPRPKVQSPMPKVPAAQRAFQKQGLRRIVLDAKGRTPLTAKLASDESAGLTTVVVNESAPRRRVAALARRVKVLVAPGSGRKINLPWLLKKLGSESVTSLLVEGGGEVNASFLLQGLAQRIAFFYAPMILGGRDAHRAVAGEGARSMAESLSLSGLEWRRLGPDWLLTARVGSR